MSTLSSTILNGLCGAVFGNTAYSAGATLYAAAVYDATDGLTGGTEVSTSGTGYSRTAISNNTSNFPAPSAGVTTNANVITLPTSTAAWHASGHPINCIRFYSASSGGTLLGGAILSPTATVDASGITISIPASQLTLTVSS